MSRWAWRQCWILQGAERRVTGRRGLAYPNHDLDIIEARSTSGQPLHPIYIVPHRQRTFAPKIAMCFARATSPLGPQVCTKIHLWGEMCVL